MNRISFESRSFIDDRGKILALNDLSLEGIKRMYQIEHPDSGMVSDWQGHKLENKWFYLIKGCFSIEYARIDNFNNPVPYTLANFKVIKSKDKVVVHIPKGYPNGLKSLEPGSIIIIFSDLILEEAKSDNFKFDANQWLN
ncbi:hypothetical protein [Belliella aquatica]|uniref:Sugar epimerase n=1 Tax=Belliella aquatica TaxID=1323734 RepID=A0ABQ1ME17_9BACT|nr:hypothetical protein [Belliella aquatica]MCH7405697.1 hypothetical protein [Belliella aquatica]GGC37069.1 sugar epimerase [Belliella aquatica]